MENQKFCLTWKDYNSHFCREFGEFRKQEDFFDVTLACEENTVTAHKIVLSAASEFFKTSQLLHYYKYYDEIFSNPYFSPEETQT